ncbi:MAG: hypothetical protein AABX16_04945 [Nanoarchaeota archaeon]
MKSKKGDEEKRETQTKGNSILVFVIASAYFVLWSALHYFVDKYQLIQLELITNILSFVALFAIIFAITHFVLSMLLLQK